MRKLTTNYNPIRTLQSFDINGINTLYVDELSKNKFVVCKDEKKLYKSDNPFDCFIYVARELGVRL